MGEVLFLAAALILADAIFGKFKLGNKNVVFSGDRFEMQVLVSIIIVIVALNLL